LAIGTSAEKSVDELIAFVWNLDEVADVRPCMSLLNGLA
jgi:hypothetical protein